MNKCFIHFSFFNFIPNKDCLFTLLRFLVNNLIQYNTMHVRQTIRSLQIKYFSSFPPVMSNRISIKKMFSTQAFITSIYNSSVIFVHLSFQYPGVCHQPPIVWWSDSVLVSLSSAGGIRVCPLFLDWFHFTHFLGGFCIRYRIFGTLAPSQRSW